jgi:hypothetical protein
MSCNTNPSELYLKAFPDGMDQRKMNERLNMLFSNDNGCAANCVDPFPMRHKPEPVKLVVDRDEYKDLYFRDQAAGSRLKPCVYISPTC